MPAKSNQGSAKMPPDLQIRSQARHFAIAKSLASSGNCFPQIARKHDISLYPFCSALQKARLAIAFCMLCFGNILQRCFLHFARLAMLFCNAS